ncbi:cytochrome P450 [Colletotrichum abscissum]|uniref:Cytochrome P450 n=1 Tax=Colletotrichum abscissum TaxID=1671311 RepID=A0A9Q0B1Y8_9PEZI|nr:cytochrome P450 [Colletotrichum abscissum]
MASYPVTYVRSLEAKVKSLEKEINSLRSATGRELDSRAELINPDTSDINIALGRQETEANSTNLLYEPSPTQLPLLQSSPSFVEELKILSFEATADRHLGSSSGLSFAKLTQTVLRRLNPDKADFSFAHFEPEGGIWPQLNLPSSTSDLLDSTLFSGFRDSFMCYPSMLDGFSPTAPTEPISLPEQQVSLEGSHVDQLIRFYFAHSHTLYPIVHRQEFNNILEHVRADPQCALAQSSLCQFRLWMVLAIGSTAQCSVTLSDEHESMMYYKKALEHFEGALDYGYMAALEVLLLQVSYSFFNQLEPNTWTLVGLGARMAIGLGMHASSTYEGLPADVSEKRKRLFFSVYMMDRVVSIALGRPFAINEDDIDVTPFAVENDSDVGAQIDLLENSFKPSILTVPLHILELRQIASNITTSVYSHRMSASLNAEQREELSNSLHQRLLNWRRNMPFPLPNTDAAVPHLNSSWYDFNYYLHVAMLYRPSPLFPTLPEPRVKVCLAYNWLNLLSIFTATLSLIYATTAQPDNLISVLRDKGAVADLDLTIELFDKLSVKFPVAGVIEEAFSLVPVLATTLALLACYVAYNVAFGTDIPHIKGLPQMPGAVPMFGHLLRLGEDHASTCENWWRKGNPSTFQIKLGNTRAVVFNSYEDIRRLLIGYQNAVIDRPKLYTFHGLISSTQGFTIGSSPWDDSCRRKRKAAGTALGRPALRSYYPMFDLESYCILRDLHKDSRNGEVEISVRPYIQRYALNTTLTLCYGIRMDAVYDDLLREILHVGSAISLLRSASENTQDYVPIMRYFPNNEKSRRSKDLRERRDAYLNLLLDKVREQIKRGTDKPCISAAILKNEETKLSEVEVSSICLSLVSGGFETIPGTLTSAIGSLATKEGQAWQDRAYEDIKRYYPDVREAWASCYAEEKIPYINAIIREAGRYYTVSSMSLPRKTVTEVNWNGAIIPPKTMILVNAQAGNHDVRHFGDDAGHFDPERWLESLNPPTEKEISGVGHLSFGLGSRGCSGQYIAQRLLYAALVRLLSSYKIVASEEEPPNTDYVEYNQFKTALVAIPKDFKVKLIPRDTSVTSDCLRAAEERTREHYVEQGSWDTSMHV